MVALDRIPNSDRPWDEWNRVGMALWAATGGDDAGRQGLHNWSARSDKYDPDETEARWEHYRTSPPTRIGAGTLFHMANEALFAGFGAGEGVDPSHFDAPPVEGRRWRRQSQWRRRAEAGRRKPGRPR